MVTSKSAKDKAIESGKVAKASKPKSKEQAIEDWKKQKHVQGFDSKADAGGLN